MKMLEVNKWSRTKSRVRTAAIIVDLSSTDPKVGRERSTYLYPSKTPSRESNTEDVVG